MNALRSRPALAAALSCSLAGPSLPAQATGGQPMTEQCRRIEAVLAQLDARFDAGDVAGYLAAFQPDNPDAHAARHRRLQCLLGSEPRPQRVSEVVGTPREIADRTVVRVRHELQRRAPRRSDETGWQEETMLALRRLEDGTFVATLEVPISTTAHAKGDAFRCPPCGYEIGGAPGWLCVPMEQECGQSLESVGFWLIGTDLVCELAVQVDASAPTPTQVVELVAGTNHGTESSRSLGPVTEWRPPAHAASADAAQANALARLGKGARVEITDTATDPPSRAVLHVLTFGALQHILLASGSEPSMRRHADALQALLRTYRVLDVEPKKLVSGLSPLLRHNGGTLDGVAYHNETFRLACTGPADWHARQLCNGTGFRVRWQNDHHSSMELIGYRRPLGLTKWSTDRATAFVQRLMTETKLAPCQRTKSFEWQADSTTGTVACCIHCARDADAPASVPNRALHLVVRDDVLLVFDATMADPEAEHAVRAAMQSLTRR